MSFPPPQPTRCLASSFPSSGVALASVCPLPKPPHLYLGLPDVHYSQINIICYNVISIKIAARVLVDITKIILNVYQKAQELEELKQCWRQESRGRIMLPHCKTYIAALIKASSQTWKVPPSCRPDTPTPARDTGSPSGTSWGDLAPSGTQPGKLPPLLKAGTLLPPQVPGPCRALGPYGPGSLSHGEQPAIQSREAPSAPSNSTRRASGRLWH